MPEKSRRFNASLRVPSEKEFSPSTLDSKDYGFTVPTIAWDDMEELVNTIGVFDAQELNLNVENVLTGHAFTENSEDYDHEKFNRIKFFNPRNSSAADLVFLGIRLKI